MLRLEPWRCHQLTCTSSTYTRIRHACRVDGVRSCEALLLGVKYECSLNVGYPSNLHRLVFEIDSLCFLWLSRRRMRHLTVGRWAEAAKVSRCGSSGGSLARRQVMAQQKGIDKGIVAQLARSITQILVCHIPAWVLLRVS